MNINKVKSILRMNDFYFPNLNVKREKNIQSGEIEIDVTKDVQSTDSNNCIIILSLNINKDDLKVHVEAVGDFTYEGNTIPEHGFVTNAISIMFPFIRSQVTLLTSQPNMAPIVIPPVNINKLLEQNENK